GRRSAADEPVQTVRRAGPRGAVQDGVRRRGREAPRAHESGAEEEGAVEQLDGEGQKGGRRGEEGAGRDQADRQAREDTSQRDERARGAGASVGDGVRGAEAGGEGGRGRRGEGPLRGAVRADSGGEGEDEGEEGREEECQAERRCFGGRGSAGVER